MVSVLGSLSAVLVFSASAEVATTVRVIGRLLSPSLAVSVRPTNWASVRVQVPSALRVPALRVASAGTPEIVTLEIVSEPSMSFKAAAMDNAVVKVPVPSP